MKYILILIIILFCSLGFAGELKIPFNCYPKQIQTKLAERGYKLDLSANDRDENSWGFLESRGSSYSIFTYQSVDKETFKVLQEVIMEN